MQEGERWKHVPSPLLFILLHLCFLSLGTKFGLVENTGSCPPSPWKYGPPHGSSFTSELLSFPPLLSQPFRSWQLQTLSHFPPTIYLASGSALSLHPGQCKPKLLSCSSPAWKTAPAKPTLVSNLPKVVFFTGTSLKRRGRTIKHCEHLLGIMMDSPLLCVFTWIVSVSKRQKKNALFQALGGFFIQPDDYVSLSWSWNLYSHFTFLSFLETLNMSIKTLQLHIKAIIKIKDTCLNGFKTVWTTVLKGQQSMAQHPVGSQ